MTINPVNVEQTLPIRLALIWMDEVTIAASPEAFARLEACARSYRERYGESSAGQVEGVQAARRLFRAIGIEPTRRRPSSEALLNRALKNKGFYSVNNLVDVSNWCSLEFLLPICVYDRDKIRGKITIRQGRPGESYLALNDRELHLEGRYLIADEEGPFGSPMTDSRRTAIDESTRRVLLILFAPKDYDAETLRRQAETYAARVQQFCGGTPVTIEIL